ncbi:MAG: hypothetical protein ABIU05_13455 [Nitrospirales bacterium]
MGSRRFDEVLAALIPPHRLGLGRIDVGVYAKWVLAFFEVLPLLGIVPYGSFQGLTILPIGYRVLAVTDPL